MQRLVQSSIPLLVSACLAGQMAGAGPQDPISSLEYDLIATAILANTSTIYTLDSTNSFTCPITKGTPVLPGSTCNGYELVAEPVPWADFAKVNEHAFPISASALSRRGIRMKGPRPSIEHATCPVGPAWILVTRAAFSSDSSKAMLAFHIFAGRGASFNGCGYSGGDLSLWERGSDGVWTRTQRYGWTIS